MAAVALVSLAAGVVVGARHGDDRRQVGERYASAYARGDLDAMYALLAPSVQGRLTRARFGELDRAARATATAAGRARVGQARRDGDRVAVPLAVPTRVFGTVRASLEIPVDDHGRVPWTRALLFPGLREGEALSRRLRMPPRATLLTRDGQVLAEGAARTPAESVADIAPDLVGQLGEPAADRVAALTALGVPKGTTVGTTGLERALDERLLGRPGGVLKAGGRVLASSVPRQSPAVRTTIAPSVERVAISALAGRLGGVSVMEPTSGAVLAYAGIAFSGLQPPGSTFKIITLTGALEARVAKPSDSYPVQTAATLEGVELENANGESCGGTLTQSFARSCNSVFAPLGVALGAGRLVGVAERYGFNAPSPIPGAATSSIPRAGAIGDDLAVGSTAIGQGRVLATALQMSTVAATIARDGRRPRATLDADAARRAAPTTRVTSAATARTVERMMLAVVREGTGTAAALSGVPVAGKTGTAELETTKRCEPVVPEPGQPVDPESCQDDPADDPTDTDAWFAAYAPAGAGRTPRVAVGVLLVRAGAGGDSAAPVAREVLRAALSR